MSSRALRRAQLPPHREHPLADRDQAQGTEEPQRGRQHVRHAEARQQGGDPDDDEALGPLGDADVGGRADGLRTGLGVGRDLAGHEGEGGRRGDPRLVVERPVEGEAAEDGAVGQPVEGGVEEVAPRAGRARHAGHRAVEQVAQRQHDEQQDGEHEQSLRQAHERHGDGPGGSHERHGVGRDVHAQEQPRRWLDEAADGLARSRVVEHVPMLSAARAAGSGVPRPGCFGRRAG